MVNTSKEEFLKQISHTNVYKYTYKYTDSSEVVMKPKHPGFCFFVSLLIETSHPFLSGVDGMLKILCPHLRFSC